MNIFAVLSEQDAVVITSPANLFYISGIANADAIIILMKDRNYYITSPLYEVEVRQNLPSEFEPLIIRGESRVSAVRRLLGDLSKVGIEGGSMDVDTYFGLFDKKDCRIVDISDRFLSQRTIKAPYELERIKVAESIVEYAFSKTVDALHEGITEKEVRYLLQDEMFRQGADGLAFDTIVAFGENAAKPHAVPSDRALRKGDCIVMDFGAKYKGYCSDFTRTLYCGTPSDRFLEAYACVLKAHKDAIDYVDRGGIKASEADAVARKVIEDSCFSGLFNHSLGHGVGVEIHEAPYLKPNSMDMLLDNEVFTIEPGLYSEGEFGIRIESLVALENGKLTVIDRSSKEIITV